MQTIINNQFLSKLRKVLFYNRYLGFAEYRLKKFVNRASLEIKKEESVLDAGAGECQYKKYFKHTKYVSQDLCVGDSEWDFTKIDIVSEIYSIPVEDASFDNILCIEVMEHLKYPHKAFKEFGRILKSRGRLFVVCPLTWGEHQKPHDYFRYTQFALKMLADDNGFDVMEMEKQGGKFICLSQIITELAPSFFIDRGFIKTGYFFKAIFYPLNFPLAFLLYFLDKTDKQKDLTPQYECVFIKK